jgi:hypothetical protein
MHACWPRTEDLAFEPELAPLALLEAALAITVQALIARNPELLAGDDALHKAPLAAAAHNIIVLYRQMHDALDSYRALLPPTYDPQAGFDDIPF